ncbi:hypothetical protein R8Z57_12580 [Microbacterium sp. M3]|uniref:Phenylacetate--CoA ligase family protein n=1 Tax=Microbacterium arthrosphaerae TaxID=792652 RepID=A0ABU4H2Q8_9MICO|nr:MULTISPECIES: hypothetical protein [Microbacterium]MDW4573611.1 hypothetical protein [Microbacterium arthrosphaerae]MDW7607466.1 hypothetical protein [Microbacterium sp. M3]
MRRTVFELKTALLMRRDRTALADMRIVERSPSDMVARLTEERSAAIALHAFRTTPYYRRRFLEAGFTETDVAQPENFPSLPVLTKQDIHDAGDELISRDRPPRDRLLSRTGGSTGRPLAVYNDRAAPTAALWWRIYGWWGVHPGDNSAFIYRQSRTGLRRVVHEAQWWPTRQLLLDARGTTDADLEEFIAQLARVRPALLVGYVEGVHAFARRVQASTPRIPPIRAISVTASMIHAGQRDFIEDVLRAPVYDTYRTAEVPWVAAECRERNGLHVLADHRRLEVVDADCAPRGDGESGDVLLTDLGNRVFPLVRYAIGDRTHWMAGACGCGLTLPRIAGIQGRVADALRTPGGRMLSGGLGSLFVDHPGTIAQFQIHQRADFSIVVRYVPLGDPGASEAAARHAADKVAGFLAHEVSVTTAAVAEIESVDGKARLVVSDLAV